MTSLPNPSSLAHLRQSTWPSKSSNPQDETPAKGLKVVTSPAPKPKKRPLPKKNVPTCDKVAWIFGGIGAQWKTMGTRLLYFQDTFRNTIARLASHLKQYDPKSSVSDLVSLFAKGSKWTDKRYSGIGICAYQIGVINILREAGLRPDYVLGHSLGETATGYARGLQTERQTILIQYVRSKMIRKIRPGQHCLRTKRDIDGLELMLKSGNHNHYYIFDIEDYKKNYEIHGNQNRNNEILYDMNGQMSVVGLSADIIKAAIQELNLTQTCVACENSPAGQTVSGAAVEVNQLQLHLEKRHEKLFWRNIDTDCVAYHSPFFICFYDWLVTEFQQILNISSGTNTKTNSNSNSKNKTKTNSSNGSSSSNNTTMFDMDEDEHETKGIEETEMAAAAKQFGNFVSDDDYDNTETQTNLNHNQETMRWKKRMLALYSTGNSDDDDDDDDDDPNEEEDEDLSNQDTSNNGKQDASVHSKYLLMAQKDGDVPGVSWLSTSSVDPARVALDAHYHARNVTSAVLFQRAIESVPSGTLFVEVGSSKSLVGQIVRTRKHINDANSSFLGLVSVGDKETEGIYLNSNLLCTSLWKAGYIGAFGLHRGCKSFPDVKSTMSFESEAAWVLINKTGKRKKRRKIMSEKVKKSQKKSF